MSRSGYVDDLQDYQLHLYRGRVVRATKGKRGQSFLRELATAMDNMENKVLIANELINADGDCCAIGVVCKSRGDDVTGVDYYCPDNVGALVGIARTLAAEVEYINDEDGRYDETPQDRWSRVRKWVESQIIKDQTND